MKTEQKPMIAKNKDGQHAISHASVVKGQNKATKQQ
jgi:hypothetical protein